jgi:tetratricopeptide (TPR) repeat protein
MTTPVRTQTRRLSLAFAILLILIGTAPRVSTDGAAFQQPDMGGRLDRVEQWLKAVMRHEPGTADDAAGLVGSWSNSELRMLWIDSNVMAQWMRNSKGVGFNVRSEGQRASQKIAYSVAQFRHLKALGCAAGGMVDQPECLAIKASISVGADLLRLSSLAGAAKRRGDDNYVLRRGALLHADIAMLVGVGSEPVSITRAPGPERLRMNISDGLETDIGQVAVHWEIARMLLDYVKPPGADKPAPGRDEMVRQWYRATAAWMQMTESHDTLHLNRAREIFPADPDLLFLSGCQRETYAAARIQSAVRTAVLPTGVRIDIGSDQEELHQAEIFLGRALKANPDMAEAHLHFGRVLSLRDRQAEAVTELRQALASMDDELLHYYGELFLGAAEEALGHFDAARDAYVEAAALGPAAQSPRIALSALARRRGDRAAALSEMNKVFELASAEPEPDDPFWTYHTAQARNADNLLEQLRQPFLTEIER